VDHIPGATNEVQRTPGDYPGDQAAQFNQRSRQNEQAYEQLERHRQESLRQERERQASAAPAPNYNHPYQVITPKSTMLCQKSFNRRPATECEAFTIP
jgi:hypothetical protein